MVDVKTFVANVLDIAEERPTYRLGGDGSDGTCDCIGLIIGAIRRAGDRWTGTHGTNYAVRNEMAAIYKQIDATQLERGWVVYKAKAPGEEGYALPSRYDGDPDRLDYYHVGVVTGVEPLEITHCTSGGGADGIVTDNRQGKWLYGGPLKLVDYGEEETIVEMAVVKASSGNTVNMRKAPDGALLARVPVGGTVNVLERETEWSKIAWDGKIGYMQTRFLEIDGEEVSEGEKVMVSLSRSAAGELLSAIKAAGIQ